MNTAPKYVQIRDYYIKNIENGNIKFDEYLPKEKEMCDMFDASRMTVNKAMIELRNLGYVNRIQGKGTIVSNEYKNTKQKTIINNSLSKEIQTAGMVPGSILIDYRVLRGTNCPEIAHELEVKDDEFIHYFARLRTGDGKPLCISYTYLTHKLLPTLDITQLEGSFNKYLSNLGYKRTYGYTEFKAVIANEEQEEILNDKNIVMLKQKIFWHINDKPFEITFHYFLGDRITITEELSVKCRPDGVENKQVTRGYSKINK
ncbi:MAG TPA: GntR family transcriptional regulator [Erysipelotrichaceae bacterium]|jgi:GntR family transcriptional regulator|nr:GntR family transcriptional regulator [Erysipelotrichia bacterium]HPX32070.1 GntR family transcriptional regulator [Erysipelotrichaceae bacterium]HQA84889.1 GntR family transcriptional regulator [Erysipelotrichaceae bacterium]